MEKTTDELFKLLDKNKNMEGFFKENKDEFLSGELPPFLENLLKQKNLVKADVIKASGLHEIYGYQIFSGIKHPSRDKLIQLAFGFRLDLEETQRLLKIGGGAALYPRIKRDSIIISAINNKNKIWECDLLLEEAGLETFMKKSD